MALFISGGEDSRVILSMLPANSERNAFIFLDSMNREGLIAEKAAKIFNAKFHMVKRGKTHYLDILPPSITLVGSGHEYFHVHNYEFHKRCGLNRYRAVFGGYFSDSLLKGWGIKKHKINELLGFFPQIRDPVFSHADRLTSVVVDKQTVEALNNRRKRHYERVYAIRPESADEWFELWPASMNRTMPYFHGNRRLFCSFEPFMSSGVVKISAGVPQSWKLNRRLFHVMAKPFLKPAWLLLHANGWMPYFPWYVNFFIRGFIGTIRKLQSAAGLEKEHQGPWGDWKQLLESKEWKDFTDRCIQQGEKYFGAFTKSPQQLLKDGHLTLVQQIDLMQVLSAHGR